VALGQFQTDESCRRSLFGAAHVMMRRWWRWSERVTGRRRRRNSLGRFPWGPRGTVLSNTSALPTSTVECRLMVKVHTGRRREQRRPCSCHVGAHGASRWFGPSGGPAWHQASVSPPCDPSAVWVALTQFRSSFSHEASVLFTAHSKNSLGPAHAAVANHRRISARGTIPVRSAIIIPPRKSTKYGIV
jgi:hypothetical protein